MAGTGTGRDRYPLFLSGITSGTVSGMTRNPDKVRENKARRAAQRQGLRLEKSRRRDERATDYGAYWLIQGPAPQRDSAGDVINWRAREVACGHPEFGASLDEIEKYLKDGGR